jgi:hypothetical protein
MELTPIDNKRRKTMKKIIILAMTLCFSTLIKAEETIDEMVNEDPAVLVGHLEAESVWAHPNLYDANRIREDFKKHAIVVHGIHTQENLDEFIKTAGHAFAERLQELRHLR